MQSKTRICLKLAGSECTLCIESSNCISIAYALDKYMEECGRVDLEHIVAVEGGRILGLNEVLCGEKEITVVRLVRGG